MAVANDMYSPMRSCQLTVVLLVAGALASVAVAWYGVTVDLPAFVAVDAAYEWPRIRRLSGPETQRLWRHYPPDEWVVPEGVDLQGILAGWEARPGTESSRTFVRTRVATGPLRVTPPTGPYGLRQTIVAQVAETDSGWPFRCVRGVTVHLENQMEQRWFLSPRLPYLPIWWGLLTNTLLYAATVAVPVLGAARLRRSSRRRRGLCPACGYKVSASSQCSECGHPVLNERGRGCVNERSCE